MKNIVVAFDFSKNAIHAFNYAVKYANVFSSDIYLVWVDNASLQDNVLETIEGDVRIEKKNYLKEFSQKNEPLLKGGRIHVVLRKGKVYQEVAKVAAQYEAGLVFAGTHGVSGFEQFWIGSNAYRITTSSPCPVITIRNDYDIDREIKRILVPLDSSLETKQKLPFTGKIAEKFGASIDLLKVYNTPLKIIKKRIDEFGKEAAECLTEKNLNFEMHTIETENVAAGILKYANSVHADLIAIMTEQGTTTANKFLGPYAQQLINNAPMPVISLRSKQYS